jgi:hypothetical protein
LCEHRNQGGSRRIIATIQGKPLMVSDTAKPF